MARKPKTDDIPLDRDSELAISTEKVCFVVVKAREFDVKDAVLAWLGRDDDAAGDWATVRDEAAREYKRRTASYLLGMPL